MFTVCPKCTLTLAVTANDLRIGQGYVRCGRCSNVFNALLKLSDAPPDADVGASSIAQADPASSSQVTRAISSAASDAGQANSSPAAPQPTRGAQIPASASVAATVTSPGPALARSASASAAAPASTAAAASTHPAWRSTEVAAPRPSAAPRTAPAPPAAASNTANPANRAKPASLAKPASPASPANPSNPANPVIAPPAARRAVAPAVARNDPPRTESPSADQTHADTEAIDQFELVLKTLGLSLDEDEPPLQPTGEQFTEPAHAAPESSSAPTRTIENIVLEGDDVSQSQAEVPDKPLDELEIFTRRMSQVTGEAGQPASAGGRSALPRSPSARLPSARASLPGRRSPASRTPASRAAPPAASSERGATGARSARARGGATDSSSGPPSMARVEHGDPAFEEQALLDDSRLDDRSLDEPLESESPEVEPTEGAASAADLYIPSFTEPGLPYRWAWIAGCVALGLLLILQALHHWRDRLSTSAIWGAPVRRLYAAIGAPIAPRWDLSAYEVRQQGAEFEPGKRQTIRVRFSLANHAPRAQPVPLLRLTLLDRYGRRVAQRDLAPADYWPPGHAPAAFLGSDKRVDTEVQVRDPSADSASFELDVCLRDLKGLIHCAGDANTAAGSESGAL